MSLYISDIVCSHAPLVSASGAILDYIQMAASTKAARVAYFDTLDAASKQRCLDKIAIIGSQDPHLLKNDIFSSDPNSLPSISYPDIVGPLGGQRSRRRSMSSNMAATQICDVTRANTILLYCYICLCTTFLWPLRFCLLLFLNLYKEVYLHIFKWVSFFITRRNG